MSTRPHPADGPAPPEARLADARLVERLGYAFTDPGILRQALTHPSVDQGGTPRKNRSGRRATPYERLEFLGDRVLGLAVAELLYRSFPSESEGDLARRHVALVRRESLAEVAGRIGLDDALRLSRGEETGGGRSNPSLLADACEAVIGAIYMDGGFDAAREMIERFWKPMMAEPVKPPKDAKTALQEWAQAMAKPLPAYRVVSQDGPDHEPLFVVEVTVEGLAPATCEGPTKRAAEQNAAKSLLEIIKG